MKLFIINGGLSIPYIYINTKESACNKDVDQNAYTKVADNGDIELHPLYSWLLIQEFSCQANVSVTL